MTSKLVVIPGLRTADCRPPKSAQTVFICEECGIQRPKWQGKCDDCGSWNSFIAESDRPFVVTQAELSKQMDEPVPLSNHPRFWLYRDRFIQTDFIGSSEDI